MKTLDVANADLNRVAEILGELRTTTNVYGTLANISEDEALLILRSLEARQEHHREMKRHLIINIILTELFKTNNYYDEKFKRFRKR